MRRVQVRHAAHRDERDDIELDGWHRREVISKHVRWQRDAETSERSDAAARHNRHATPAAIAP